MGRHEILHVLKEAAGEKFSFLQSTFFSSPSSSSSFCSSLLVLTFCHSIMTQSNGVPKTVPSALPLVQKLSKDHDLVLKTFRLLIADLCQQFSGGHPG